MSKKKKNSKPFICLNLNGNMVELKDAGIKNPDSGEALEMEKRFQRSINRNFIKAIENHIQEELTANVLPKLNQNEFIKVKALTVNIAIKYGD